MSEKTPKKPEATPEKDEPEEADVPRKTDSNPAGDEVGDEGAVPGPGTSIVMSCGDAERLPKKRKAPFSLSPQDLTAILHNDVSDADLIDQLVAISQERVDFEEKRQDVIERKAASIFGTSGLTGGLIFTFGGLLLEKIKPEVLNAVGIGKPLLALLYGLTIVVGFLACLFALLALRAHSRYRSVSEQDVFNREVLREGAKEFKRYFANHLWQIYTNNFEVNDTKGRWLMWSQWTFVILVFLLVVSAGIIAIAAAMS